MASKKKESSSPKSSTPKSAPKRAGKQPAEKPLTASHAATVKPPRTRAAAPTRRTRKSPEYPARSTEREAPGTQHGAPGTEHPAVSAAGNRLRILMVTPEAHPFAKTGGLAEVAAALPAALVRLGHSVTLVLPRYRAAAPEATISRQLELSMGARPIQVGYIEQDMPNGVRAVLVDVPELYDRPGLYGVGGYDFPDNGFRFAVLSRAALEYARDRGERPDIIHAHDWQTGLVPVYQKMLFSQDPIVGGVPAVFTIHNLAFQGVFGRDALAAVGLGWDVFQPEALEYWGNISLLKGGVNFSEMITTVSPTYAREILTPELGFGLDGALRRRAGDLVGILNGIDVDRWNPAADPFSAHYSAESLEGKRDAKRALLQEIRLNGSRETLDRPLIGLISRLTDQKGFDLVGAAAETLMSLDASWVVLGSGDSRYEDLWRVLAARHPRRVSTTIGFDERLAHLIEAGADMFLMPSRFEPCGLNQLYSLRYGTVPIVRATGGLDDSVMDAAQPGGNGIKFADPTPGALVAAVRRALDLFRDRPAWQALQRAGMAKDPSWDVSAREYVKVYRFAQARTQPHGI